MNRRNFIRAISVASVVGLVAPKIFLASFGPRMAGGLYYTKEYPGRWAKKIFSRSNARRWNAYVSGRLLLKDSSVKVMRGMSSHGGPSLPLS